MSSDAERAVEIPNERVIADAALAIRIYEDGEAVGVVNVDQETADYHGVSDDVSWLLDRMEEQGLSYRGPPPSDQQRKNEWAHGTATYERSGEGLAQYLLRRIERADPNDTEIRVEPIGFAPKNE